MWVTIDISSLKYPRICAVYLILVSVFVEVQGWHDLGNTLYHCWPLINPDDANMVDCPGFSMEWIDVPNTVVSEDSFNVSYRINANDIFFDWSVLNNSDYAVQYGSVFPFSSGAEAKHFCATTDCPAPNVAGVDNCCLHHINIHSCPQESLHGSICGPWVPPDGDIFTHTGSLVSPLEDSLDWWTEVRLIPSGTTSIIAHIRIGNLQAALHHVIQVIPQTVCGNGECEDDRGEDCQVCPKDCGICPLETVEIVGIVIACLFIICTFIAIILYFYIKQQKMLWDESWVIPYEDIHPDTGIRGFMGSIISVQKSYDKVTDGASSAGAMAVAAQQKQIFTQTGIFNGQTIAIKKIEKVSFSLTKSLRKEIKQVRDMNHPNLCKFIGGSIEVPNVCICSEYCPKGSLNDVLLNEDIPLNWGFRFSFCGDISRAMVYLHQHKLYHGRLKSNNCIIDDRWVVKVSDYGLRNIRKEEFGDDEYEETYQKQMARVYLPPEALDDPKNIYLPTTDVYSFSIILVEVATRNEPCSSDDVELMDGLWRPDLPDLSVAAEGDTSDELCPCPQQFTDLIKACWNEDPNERPTFSNIKQSLHRINPNKASPVDMMMQLMEKYSKHLEVLVAERTQDLVLEKQKTDRLLYSMLPKAVADQLRQGMSAAAENFDECTIFFSDIVGFTSISGSSTPYEVVALLNKLYVAFDSIIDSYDVYKVETIGDAYMVVSGVPKRNGYIHASEIASMALDLVKVCETFVIPHKPDEKLQIRAGIHSGSVVAGVVGLKMPRYCLFGDTVNTASRMESTGEALKIQASDPCVTCLKQIGSFKVECRGDMQIKGKGIMRTWWVKDKDPNIKPESKSEGYLDINQIVRDDKDNNVKKLSLEERSDDLSCQNISLPGSIEEKETNEGPEMGGFKQYDKPANLFLPPLDNGGLNIPLDSDVTEHARVPSPTDNTVPVNISHVVTSSNLNRASLPPVETITMNGAVPPSVETIADIASPMENTEKAKKKHKKKKKHKEKKRKEEKETVQNYLGSGTLKDNGDVKNGQVSVVFNESTQKFGSAEPLIGNDLESKV